MNKISASFGIAGLLIFVASLLASLYGYVHNIYALIHHVGAFGIQELVRAVGIVLFPVGVIMGYVS